MFVEVKVTAMPVANVKLPYKLKVLVPASPEKVHVEPVKLIDPTPVSVGCILNTALPPVTSMSSDCVSGKFCPVVKVMPVGEPVYLILRGAVP